MLLPSLEQQQPYQEQNCIGILESTTINVISPVLLCCANND